MSDKLNCFECKNWFDVNELIYLPTEQYYLCHHDAATHYAIKCENLRAERDAARAVVEAARRARIALTFYRQWMYENCDKTQYPFGKETEDELAAALARVEEK